MQWNMVLDETGIKGSYDYQVALPAEGKFEDIAKAVKSYKMENKSGLGAVFIVDRLVKQDKKGQGAVYVVYFDVASREVLFTQRKVSNATGFGFRNYWFRVIKDAEGTLSKYR